MSSINAGKSFLLDRYLDELKHMDDAKTTDSANEVQVLKEQLRRLSAEMVSLRQALGFQSTSPSAAAGQHHLLANQDSGYSDTLADSISAASYSSSAPKGSYSSHTCSCSSASQMTSRLTSDLHTRLDDLVKMTGPLTEESVSRVLQQRWMCGECQTKIGPVLVSLNPHRGLSQDQVLQYGQPSQYPHIVALAQTVWTQLVETRKPQAIILSGESGSGKTYTSQLLLRQLHCLHKRASTTGGGRELTENKQFKGLVAAFHVLRALGSAKTITNSQASRLGHHIEVQISGGTITRTKLQCQWFDQSRVVDTPTNEKNFHIFYQMLAGLTHEERVKFHLHGYGAHNLAYLKCRNNSDDLEKDKLRFATLRNALSTLGIEFMDIMRIMAAILLLGNVHFVDDGGYELDIKGNNEIKAVASLLGVSGVALYRALTTRTHSLKGQALKTLCNAEMANRTRDVLAMALYSRTVLAVIKRLNCVVKQNMKCQPYTAPSTSSEDTLSSCDSCTRLSDSRSELTGSTLPTEGSKHIDGTINIIDMPGFSNSQCNRVEQLCSNYASEEIQQFYLQQIFRRSHDACREDGIDINPADYVDNSLCLDFIASKQDGLFSIIDNMTNQLDQTSTDSLMERLDTRHKDSSVYTCESENRYQFTISHTSGEVRYSAADFLSSSRDVVSDDVLSIFKKKGCSFGFAAHLFAPELKLIHSHGAKGLVFRICRRPLLSSSDQPGKDSSIGSLPRDYSQRVQALLDSLKQQQTQFHFVHCIKSNDKEATNQLSPDVVRRQVRALQLVPTVQHMTEGYPHHMKITDFIKRYQVLLGRKDRKITRTDQCQVILEQLLKRCEYNKSVCVKTRWGISVNRVFFSEETRQALETSRTEHREVSARFIQSKVRCWLARRQWPVGGERCQEVKQQGRTTKITFREPLYERIQSPPASDCSMASDSSSIEYKKARLRNRIYELDDDLPPPLPSNHPSAMKVDISKGFPQTRIMKCDYKPDECCIEPVLKAGEPILVMGVGQTKEMLIVEHDSCTLHVPLKFTMTQTGDSVLGTRL